MSRALETEQAPITRQIELLSGETPRSSSPAVHLCHRLPHATDNADVRKTKGPKNETPSLIDRNSDRLCVHLYLQTTVTSPRHGAESRAAKLRRAANRSARRPAKPERVRPRKLEPPKAAGTHSERRRIDAQRRADALRKRVQALIPKDDPAGEPKALVTNWGPAT